MILPIVKWPNQVLSTPASLVQVFDDELQSFVQNMFETMISARGIGLAANQVNDLRRIITIKISDSPELVLINPEIIFQEGQTKYSEGCLSFPEIMENIIRSEKIIIKAQDTSGNPFSLTASGLLAICIQHEIDHINGIVFTDRMSRLKSSIIKKKMLNARK